MYALYVDTVSMYHLGSNEAVLIKNCCPATRCHIDVTRSDNGDANTDLLIVRSVSRDFIIFCLSKKTRERKENGRLPEKRIDVYVYIRDQLLIAICYCVRRLFPNNLSSQSRGSLWCRKSN